MTWLRENWFWLIVAISMALLHLRGHGRHTGHAPPNSNPED